jgi:hypothetical protein
MCTAHPKVHSNKNAKEKTTASPWGQRLWRGTRVRTAPLSATAAWACVGGAEDVWRRSVQHAVAGGSHGARPLERATARGQHRVELRGLTEGETARSRRREKCLASGGSRVAPCSLRLEHIMRTRWGIVPNGSAGHIQAAGRRKVQWRDASGASAGRFSGEHAAGDKGQGSRAEAAHGLGGRDARGDRGRAVCRDPGGVAG